MRHAAGTSPGPTLLGLAAAVGGAAAVRLATPVLSGPDAFWHWDVGRRIVDSGLPGGDPYSFLTAGRDWVLQQWLADAVFGAVDWAFGLVGLAVLAGLLVGVTYGQLARRARRVAPGVVGVGLVALAVLAGARGWALRGSLFTLALLPLLLSELRRPHGPRPWVVIGLFGLWANLHAGFVAALGLLGAHQLGAVIDAEARRAAARRAGLLVAGATAASLLTPYGPRLWTTAVELVTRTRDAGITEWAPTAVTDPPVIPFTLLVAVVVLAMMVGPHRPPSSDAVLVVVAVLLGVSAVRNVALAAVVVAHVGLDHVGAATDTIQARASAPSVPERRALAAMAVVGVVLLVALVPRSNAVEDHVSGIPIGLIRAVDGVPGDHRVLADSRWAPAVAALTGPDVRTAVDGRLELFTRDELADGRTALAAAAGWPDVVADWCVTDVLVPADGDLSRELTSRGMPPRETAAVLRRTEVAAWHEVPTPGPACS